MLPRPLENLSQVPPALYLPLQEVSGGGVGGGVEAVWWCGGGVVVWRQCGGVVGVEVV